MDEPEGSASSARVKRLEDELHYLRELVDDFILTEEKKGIQLWQKITKAWAKLRAR